MLRSLPLIILCLLTIVEGPRAQTQEEKIIWVHVTDTRGRSLPNITISTLEWGKAVTTTSSGKAGVPVPNSFQITNEIHLVIISKSYQTANGLPLPIRISSFNKPYVLNEITLIPKSVRPSTRLASAKGLQRTPETDPFLKGEQAVSAQRYREALQYFSSAYDERKQAYATNKNFRLKTRYVEAARRLAEILIVVNKWREAADKFEEVLLITPSDDESSYYLGICRMMLGDLPQAEKIFHSMKSSSRRPLTRQLGGMMTAAIWEAYGKLDDSLGLEKEFFQQLSERGILTEPSVNNLFKLVSKVALDAVRRESYPSRIQPISQLAVIITYKARLAIAEKQAGKYSPQTITPLNDLATTFQTQGRYDDAEKLRIRVLNLEQRLFGDDYLSVGFGKAKLAQLETERKDYVAAEKHYREAAEVLKKSLGDDTSFMTVIHQGLFQLFLRQEHFQDAEHELQAIIAITCTSGMDTLECIGALGKLSEFYVDRERYADAAPPLRRAIDMSTKLWAAKDSEGTAIILEQIDDLESIFEHLGNKNELEALKKEKDYIRGLGVQPKKEPTIWSSKEATTAISLNGYRCAFQADDDYVKYPKSKELLEAAMPAGKYLDYRDPDFNQAMYLLAYLYFTENRFSEALVLAERALKANEDSLQPDRTRTALLLNLKAGVSFDRGDYAKAERDTVDALRTLQVVLGQNHQFTVALLMNLARIQRQRLNYVEAEKNLRLALSIREGALPENPACALPDSVTIAGELAELYVLMQKYPEAERLFKEVFRAIGDCCLDRYPGVIPILENYSKCLRQLGRNEDASRIDARARLLKSKQ